MFDLSFSEIALIAVVALVVIGPAELPAVMRSVGKAIAKAKAFTRGIWDQLELESLEKEVKQIRGDNGQLFEAYKLEDIPDASRKTQAGASPQAKETGTSPPNSDNPR